MVIIGFALLSLLLIYLFFEFQREKRRNRIMQSFIAGLVKSASDYISKTDMLDISSAEDLVKPYAKNFPIPYAELLQNIACEFEKDFWVRPYWKWLKKDRNLFYEEKYANDGFNMIYWDLFDMSVEEAEGRGPGNSDR